MKSLSRGTVVLATTVALWACSGDPTDTFRGEPASIVTTPTALFIPRGESKQVIVEVIDQQGSPLLEDVTVSGGSGLSIVEDTTYLGTTTEDGRLPHERAYIVTANELVSTSFTVSSGSVTSDVAVRVVPGTVDIPPMSVASTGPNATDPTVLTIPAPYLFIADSAVVFDAGTAITVDAAPDGRSITILPPPGTTSTGAATVAVDYIPEVPLAATTDVPLAISATVPAQPGTGSLTTAPAIPLSALGGGTWGDGTFSGTTFGADQYYQFTIPADGDYTINVDWTVAVDIDYFVCNEVTCADPDFTGATGDHPEIHDLTLTAGTYYLVVNLFTGPAPPWVRIAINPVAAQ